MAKITRLTETDLSRLVKKIINEEKFENKSVSREEYYNFFTNLPSASGQDDLYSMLNWISFTNPELADELYGMI